MCVCACVVQTLMSVLERLRLDFFVDKAGESVMDSIQRDHTPALVVLATNIIM